MKPDQLHCDLLVIGAGVAGSAAALFAAKRGIATAITGMTNQFHFVSGLMDLMGVHPQTRRPLFSLPWDIIGSMHAMLPNHPYSRIEAGKIRAAFDTYLDALAGAGLPYHWNPLQNAVLPTSAGTLKITHCVPATMWEGVLSLREKRPCLIVDFAGLKGFSAVQIAESLHTAWPNIQTARISLFDHPGDRYPEALARKLESAEVRARLTDALKPSVKNVAAIGFPAILGLTDAQSVLNDLSVQLNRPVFEIPSLPPSVPGFRLGSALEQLLSQNNVRSLTQQRVLSVTARTDDTFTCDIGIHAPTITVHSHGIILATGRFFSKGLIATRKGIREPVFHLPVFQPHRRANWHHADMLHPEGHPIHQAGVEIDDQFRPLREDGRPAYTSLFAAGTILAHQDWLRMKCGFGLSLATAHAAVNAFADMHTVASERQHRGVA